MDEATPPPPQISVFTPLLYLGVLIGAFVAFSVHYRRKRLLALAATGDIFTPHISRQFDAALAAAQPPVPTEVRRAALIRRGAESVRRMVKLQELQPVFAQLYLLGSIPDSLFERFTVTQKLLEAELQGCAAEAEAIEQGWAQKFFPVVQEVCFNEALKRRVKVEDERGAVLRELWDYQG